MPNAFSGAGTAELGAFTNLEPGTTTEPAFISWLTAHGVPYRKKMIDGFDVIVPARNVNPSAVPG